MQKLIFLIFSALFLSFTLYAQELSDENLDDFFSVPDETVEEAAVNTENIDQTEDPINSIDDLFDQPDDTKAQDDNTEEAEQVDIEALTKNDAPVIRGKLSLSGAVAMGLMSWPQLDSNDFLTELYNSFDTSAYFAMTPTISFDIRPNSYFRFYTSLSSSLSESTLRFSTPSIGELFIDYTYKDSIFFRVGDQGVAWGQGQLLNNPGNIVSDVADGVSIKSFIPLGSNGLTWLFYLNSSWGLSNITNPLYYAYAALFETTLGSLTVGFSGKYREGMSQELIGGIYLKTVIGEVDFALEYRGDFDLYYEEGSWLWPTTYAVANFFWENSDIGVKLLGEYEFAHGPGVRVMGLWTPYGRHLAGIGVSFSKLLIGNMKPGIYWKHAVMDNSGQFVIGLSGTFAPMITANLGIPLVYGKAGGYYMQNNDDPEDRLLSAALQLSISTSF